MKKILVLLLMLAMAGFLSIDAKADNSSKAQLKAEKQAIKTQAKKEKEAIKAQSKHQKQLASELKNKKDIIKDAEYKEIKTQYFNAEGYGDTYNCKVAQQRFCKVKDLDTGIYVLCDREVSRTQMESSKIFFKLGKCTKLN